MASEVHIDEMRTLLELHYDDVHLETWRSRQRDHGLRGRRARSIASNFDPVLAAGQGKRCRKVASKWEPKARAMLRMAEVSQRVVREEMCRIRVRVAHAAMI